MGNYGFVEIPPGTRFERLEVVGLLPERKNGNRVYECLCDCGTHTNVRTSSLRNGNTKSCGCLSADATRQRTLAAIARGQHPAHRHGATTKGVTPTYECWTNMKQRCSNPRYQHYKNYGGRGIAVCDRWLGPDGFPNFLADMGERPEGRSLDRIDNEGNYEPSNCRWATASEQAKNKRPRPKRVCSVEGCDRRHYGLGLCSLHHKRAWIASKQRPASA